MPVSCKEIGGKHRIIGPDGKLETNAAGTAVDGGGHGSKDDCTRQARAINSSLARKLAKHGEHDQTSHGRGGGGGRVKQEKKSHKTKSETAKASAVRVDSDIQRYSEERNEPQLAKMLDGTSLDDNEPVDVVTEIDGKKHGVELKTQTVGENNKITMKKDSIERKERWARKNKGNTHTVVFDDTQVYNAKGPGKHDTSKRRILYKRGSGSFRTGSMHEVTGGATELKQLMSARKNQLPVAAGGTKK